MEFVGEALRKLREKRPLVHNITNYVVMNETANALLAIGASPVMAHAVGEIEEMVSIADALVINIGTLDGRWIESMELAVRAASRLGKPVVLDPVGAGATKLRTSTAMRLIELGDISVIRGNFGEISALLGEHGKTRGVDAAHFSAEDASELAEAASERFGSVVAVTGPVDFVSNGKTTYAVENGHELLGRVTGTGCMATAITGAFLAVEEPLRASISALVAFEVAAEKASEEAPYPGSFHAKLYDWLYRITPELLVERGRVRRV